MSNSTSTLPPLKCQRGKKEFCRTGEVVVSDQQAGSVGVDNFCPTFGCVRLETGDAVLLYSLQLDIARIIVFSLEMSIQWHDDR